MLCIDPRADASIRPYKKAETTLQRIHPVQTGATKIIF